MEAILGAVMAQLVPVAVTLVCTLASVGLFYANRWIKAKTGCEALGAITEVGRATVSELNATLVKEAKVRSADGTLSKADGEEIKAVAMETLSAAIPAATRKAAEAVVADLDKFISGKLEHLVEEAKK